MDRRMYFVLSDLAVAEHVERSLLLARVDSSRMHFLGKRDADLGDLPQAGTAQKSDIRHGMYVGTCWGAIAGGLRAAGVCWRPGWVGMPVTATVVLRLGGFRAVFGVVTSGALIGSSMP